jgi:transcriptional regulator with XRE-family HTH domain
MVQFTIEDQRNLNRKIGRAIKKIRMARKMSQETVAASLDISYQQLQKYECGKNRISAARLLCLCHVLGIIVEDVLKYLEESETEDASIFTNHDLTN